MPFKDKIWYIWEYYKLHIIAFVIIVIIAGSVINNILNPPVPPYAGIAFYEVYTSEEQNGILTQTLSDFLIDDPNEYEIYLHPLLSGGDPQAEMAMMQKFMAMIMVNEIDLIIAEKEAFEAFAREAYFLDINLTGISVPDASLLKSATIEDGDIRPYGISLDASGLFNQMGFMSPDTFYIGVTVNTDKREHVTAILNVLFR